ncbi:MAG TPA: hypothetical protein VEP90_27720, partial [Methylomirabilota bacterium]|nr:hypothetical protein [Methylomirabilota bacterium]
IRRQCKARRTVSTKRAPNILQNMIESIALYKSMKQEAIILQDIARRLQASEAVRLLSGGKEETRQERSQRHFERVFGPEVLPEDLGGESLVYELRTFNTSFARSEIPAQPEEVEMLLRKIDALKTWIVDEGHGRDMSPFSNPAIDLDYSGIYSYMTPTNRENRVLISTNYPAAPDLDRLHLAPRVAVSLERHELDRIFSADFQANTFSLRIAFPDAEKPAEMAPLEYIANAPLTEMTDEEYTILSYVFDRFIEEEHIFFDPLSDADA